MAVTGQIESTQAVIRAADVMSPVRYRTWLLSIVAATFAFRVWFGSRGSFTGDDFEFRSLVSQPLSLEMLLTGHNGHLNPIGLFLQWSLQQAFPGRYVPLVVLSAVLVATSQIAFGGWAALVFGRRWIPLVAVLMTGMSLMLLELATWWSVALYAAPMVALASLTLLLTTRFLLGLCPLWMPVLAQAMCLLCSTKAITLPILLVGVASGLALGRPAPLGFRAALARYRTFWFALSGLLAGYAVIFSIARGPVATGDPSGADLVGFVWSLLRSAAFPAIWGGPWQWASLGFHTAPAPQPALQWLSTVAVVVAVGWMLATRPRVWRLMLCAAVMIAASSLLVALGRAGSVWGAPMLRYTFDFLLPVVTVMCAGLLPTRWEERPWGVLRRRPPAVVRRAFGVAATTAWLLSIAVSYVVPWQVLPHNPMKSWVANARAGYPALGGVILEQRAPGAIALFPMPVGTFLAGDPGAPASSRMVLDRALGFNDAGHLVDRYVQGAQVVAPADCSYRGDKLRPAVVPLPGALLPGLHTIGIDYTLSTPSPAEVTFGGTPVAGQLPAGTRRVFVSVEGGGQQVSIAVKEPNATICVLGLTVGDLVDGPRVDPATVP